VWTLHRAQLRYLETFHIKYLQRILSITWKDRVSHVQCREQTTAMRRSRCSSSSAATSLERRKTVFHGKFSMANCLRSTIPRWTKKRFSDHLPSILEAQHSTSEYGGHNCIQQGMTYHLSSTALEPLMIAVNVDVIDLRDNPSNPVLVCYTPLVDESGPLTSASIPINKATCSATSQSQ